MYYTTIWTLGSLLRDSGITVDVVGIVRSLCNFAGGVDRLGYFKIAEAGVTIRRAPAT